MTSGCWALVAVKTRVDCKSRLAGQLAAESRLSLVRLMLQRALAALRGSRTVTHITVVTPERDTIPADVHVVPDPGGGLNAALDAARDVLVGMGAPELLVLHADLPLVTAADIDLLVEAGRRTGFALATDAAGTGTNALYVAPPGSVRFRFGPGSRFRHLEEAARLGVQAELVRSRGFELDLDGPADLNRLLALHEGGYDSLPLLAADEPDTGSASIAPAAGAFSRR
jgi:2-phospho-L-lactate/phosphoenolpyruvate guanylyltransferase